MYNTIYYWAWSIMFYGAPGAQPFLEIGLRRNAVIYRSNIHHEGISAFTPWTFT
jgi:hypothetical protein